uniref:RNA polymerase alpha subunit n=1 Tax=Watanabea sichuanensis TaxID=2704660 RepID=UPI002410D90B|nr:RNA polymerase alpha subunit [Watanabea sichuanensis]WDY13159.1 RNA polymerase alpha subunit [Watanabea sichuanensis]
MENLVIFCLESRIENNRNLYGRFLLGPFMTGHAITIATALRRALLSEIKGVAITALEIQGTTHEFSTIEGVRESVLDIALNFQQIVLHSEIDLTIPEVGYLQIQGPAVVRAMDLKLPLGIQCVDPTQYIATLSTGSVLVLKFLIARRDKRDKNPVCKKDNTLIKARHVKKAKAFYAERENKDFKSEICFRNIIPLDSMFTPVQRVNFLLQSDDLSNKPRERLVFEVWTNGSIHPRQAIHEAALSLIKLFSIFRKISHLDSHSGISFDARKSTRLRKADTEKSKKGKTRSMYSALQKSTQTLSSFTNPKTGQTLLCKPSRTVRPLYLRDNLRDNVNLVEPQESLSGAASHPRPRRGRLGRETSSSPFRGRKDGQRGKDQKLSSSQSTVGFKKSSLQQSELKNSSTPSYKVRLMKTLASLYKTDFDKSSFLSLDLSNFSLSLKAYTLLKQNGIHTIDELLKYSAKELFELFHKDKQMFYDVKNCILRLGLQMKK